MHIYALFSYKPYDLSSFIHFRRKHALQNVYKFRFFYILAHFMKSGEPAI